MVDEKKLMEDLIPVLNQHGDMYFAGRVIGLIDGQPKTSSWIPCIKKLPEAGEFYIATYRFEDETFLKCHELYYGTADGKTEPGWYLDDDGQELYKPFEVTAWQPLPEPYSPQ